MHCKKILVTGGAGFIGSHLVDRLLKLGFDVLVFDDFSTGKIKNMRKWIGHSKFSYIHSSLLNRRSVEEAVSDREIVFHLAACRDVKLSDPRIHFERNILATYNLLEAVRKSKITNSIVFTSTSTVYGDAKQIPTREDYGPLIPISFYGASKLACETLISAYCHTFNKKAVIYRIANVVGERCDHGVIYDFIKKLQKQPDILKILGDGSQRKSYIHIDDCVEAILNTFQQTCDDVEIFNLGSEDAVDVMTVARIVIEEMNLKNVDITSSCSVEDGRGWIGDVKNMQLDISKLKTVGWKPKYDSTTAVRLATRALLRK